ncbi:hypothetical protein [Laspinema olomoucense]|uniref:Uncharacterized protein n=1 Tax=Laspinema olomoucense D3b TaxID=2953688 RepID=A0ABT2NEU6_9CYAN|nr:hypothetical protein [Laspinema sp. D3b]MCT7981233.1 hypothetical protein [Laspinema sp. D3b]
MQPQPVIFRDAVADDAEIVGNGLMLLSGLICIASGAICLPVVFRIIFDEKR